MSFPPPSVHRTYSLRHPHHHQQQPSRSRRRSDRTAGGASRRSRPQGDGGEETDADSSTGSAKSGRSGKSQQDASVPLPQLYLETKTEMLGIIEEELKLKIEVKSIKEQFLNLLQYYQEFQESCDDWTDSMSAALGVGTVSNGRDLLTDRGGSKVSSARCSEDPQLPLLDFTDSSNESDGLQAIRSAPHTTAVSEISEMMSLNTEANTTEGPSIDVDADVSVDVDVDVPDSPKGPSKRTKSKFATDSDSVLPSSIDSDACNTQSDHETDYKSLKDISQITKCSDYSLYDPLSYSALAGPLHSTLNYTLGSTPSKAPKPIDPNVNSMSSLCQIEEERPSPMGMDDIHCQQPLNKLLVNVTPATPKAIAAAHGTTTDTTCSSLDESTPIIVTKFRRRSKRPSYAPPGETPDDSGLCSYRGSSNTTEDTPTTIRKLSRDEYLTLNEDGSREGSNSHASGGNDDTDDHGLDSASGTPSIMKEGRQGPQGVSMTGLRQPGVGLSMGDLLGLVSWNADQDSVSSSVDGTRASEASPGGLTLPSTCSDGLRSSSDITSVSSFQFSSMTTESSYKESDASSIPNLPEDNQERSALPLKSKYPRSIMHSTAMSTDSLSEPCAPMNSPNTTADDFSLSSRPISNQSASSRALTSASSQDNFRFPVYEINEATAGPRPACIGGEQQLANKLNIQAPQQKAADLAPEKSALSNKTETEESGSTSSQPPLPSIPDSCESDLPFITPLAESDSDTGSDEIDVDKHTPRRTPQQATGMKKLTLMRRLRNFKRHFRANSRSRKSSGSSSKNTSKESR